MSFLSLACRIRSLYYPRVYNDNLLTSQNCAIPATVASVPSELCLVLRPGAVASSTLRERINATLEYPAYEIILENYCAVALPEIPRSRETEIQSPDPPHSQLTLTLCASHAAYIIQLPQHLRRILEFDVRFQHFLVFSPKWIFLLECDSLKIIICTIQMLHTNILYRYLSTSE